MKHFFDVGANNGSTFDRYITKHPELDGAHIWCFEPSPRCWPALMAKAESLSKRYAITLCTFGLSGIWGASQFFQQSLTEGDTFIPNAISFMGTPAIPEKLGWNMMAATIPLSSFIVLKTDPTDEITVKLDCEGTEYSMLKDLLKLEDARSRIKKLMVEWHIVPGIDYVKEGQELKEEFARCGRPIEGWGY